MQSFRIDVGDLPEKRPPRSYKFVEVASRNARSIVSSAALFGPADPSERRPEEEDSEVAKKGLYALPNVPYKCQGTPDVDLTSMSPKEARTHVMHMRKQLQQEQEEAAAAARQNVAKRRDKALRAAAVGRGGRWRRRSPRAKAAARAHHDDAISITTTSTARQRRREDDAKAVAPRYTRPTRSNVTTSNGFAALMQHVNASTRRLQAMRGGSASIFDLGVVTPREMSEARMGNNSIDQVVHSSRAQLSLSAVESAPPDASAAATGALASTRSRSSRRSRRTATRGTARSRGTAGRSSTRTGTAKSGRSQRSAGANQRASTADLVHEVSSRFVAMLNKYLAADAASVAARVLEAADAIQVASRRGQAAMAAARGNAADSTAASEPDSPNSRAAPTPLPRTAHSATLGTTATSGSQQQQQREAASGDDASHHGRRSKPAPPRVDFDIIAADHTSQQFASLAFKSVKHGGLLGLSYPSDLAPPGTQPYTALSSPASRRGMRQRSTAAAGGRSSRDAKARSDNATATTNAESGKGSGSGSGSGSGGSNKGAGGGASPVVPPLALDKLVASREGRDGLQPSFSTETINATTQRATGQRMPPSPTPPPYLPLSSTVPPPNYAKIPAYMVSPASALCSHKPHARAQPADRVASQRPTPWRSVSHHVHKAAAKSSRARGAMRQETQRQGDVFAQLMAMDAPRMPSHRAGARGRSGMGSRAPRAGTSAGGRWTSMSRHHRHHSGAASVAPSRAESVASDVGFGFPMASGSPGPSGAQASAAVSGGGGGGGAAPLPVPHGSGLPPQPGDVSPRMMGGLKVTVPATARDTDYMQELQSYTARRKKALAAGSIGAEAESEAGADDEDDDMGMKDVALGLGDCFELDKQRGVDQLKKLLEALEEERAMTLRIKNQAFSTVAAMPELAAAPAEEQVDLIRNLAEALRVRELQARYAGTEWFDTLLRLCAECPDPVTGSDRFLLHLIGELLRRGDPFGRDTLLHLSHSLDSKEHVSLGVQRIFAYLRRLLSVPLLEWDETLRQQGLPHSIEVVAPELCEQEARQYHWVRSHAQGTKAAQGGDTPTTGAVRPPSDSGGLNKQQQQRQKKQKQNHSKHSSGQQRHRTHAKKGAATRAPSPIR